MAYGIYVQDNLSFDASYRNQGNGTITFSGTASYSTTSFVSSSAGIVYSGTASYKAGTLARSGVAQITYSGAEAVFWCIDPRPNWVAWSKIGAVDFTIDRVNDAGNFPMPWQGEVYAVRTLEKHDTKYVVAYGSGGVVLMQPDKGSPAFGFRHVSSLGLRSRYLVTGHPEVHYFVDSKGDLNELKIGGYGVPELQTLGYSEYLTQLTGTPVMHYDTMQQRVYFCDGTRGFIYCVGFGMGSGPATLTGVTKLGISTLFAAPAAVSTQTLQVCTDILDFGTRNLKTISGAYLVTNVNARFEGQVDYRYDIRQPWQTTAWVAQNSRGLIPLWISGVEFRVRVKSLDVIAIEVDDLVVMVNMNDRDLVGNAVFGGSQ